MRHKRCAKPARTNRCQLLGLRQAVEYVEAFAMPAIFFGVAQTEDASLRRFLMERTRQFAFNLPTVNMRRYFTFNKPADGLRQRLMAFLIIRRTRAPIVKIAHLPVTAVVIQ
jgi:hypothetical protein